MAQQDVSIESLSRDTVDVRPEEAGGPSNGNGHKKAGPVRVPSFGKPTKDRSRRTFDQTAKPGGLNPGRQVVDRQQFTDASGWLNIRHHGLQRDEGTLEAVKLIRDLDPQASHAVWNFLRLTNPGFDFKAYTFAQDGSETEEAGEAQSLLDDLARWIGREYGGGLDQLHNVLALQLLTHGANCLEVTLRTPTEIDDWYPVDPSLISFRTQEQDDGTFTMEMGQYQSHMGPDSETGDFLAFNPEQVIYQPLDPDTGDPYGRPPLVAAISELLAASQLVTDVRAMGHNQGFPRLDVKVLWTAIQAAAPQNIKDDPQQFAQWATAQLSNIVADYDSLAVDDTFIHFDYVELDQVGGGAGSFDYDALMSILERRANNALKTLPILLGINETTSETHGSIQWQIQVAGIEAMTRLIKRVIEKAGNLTLRLAGFQAHCKLTYQKIRTVDRLYEAQADFFDARNAQLAWQMGWIDNNEAAQKLYGHDAVGDPIQQQQMDQAAQAVEDQKAAQQAYLDALAAGNPLPGSPDSGTSGQGGVAPEPGQTMEPPQGEAGQGKQVQKQVKSASDMAWQLAWESMREPVGAGRRRAPQLRAPKVGPWRDESRADHYGQRGEQLFRELQGELADEMRANGALETSALDAIQMRTVSSDIGDWFNRSLARQMKGLLREAVREAIDGVDPELLDISGTPESLIDRIWNRNRPYVTRIAQELRDAIRTGDVKSEVDLAVWFDKNAWREKLMGRFVGKMGLQAGFAWASSKNTPGQLYVWTRTIDESCPSCTDRGDQQFSYEELLVQGFPGSDSLICGANCRCYIDPVFAPDTQSEAPKVEGRSGAGPFRTPGGSERAGDEAMMPSVYTPGTYPAWFEARRRELWTEDDYAKHPRDEYGKFSFGLSDEQKEAVGFFQGSSQAINAFLRSGRNPTAVPTDEVHQKVALIDAAFMAVKPIEGPITLYRGVTEAMGIKLENVARNGGTFVDRGYASTSSDRAIASDFARWTGAHGQIVQIEAPAGTRILKVDDIAMHLGCNENLLPRGTRFSGRFGSDHSTVILTVLP